jgi:exodeoxyribonuclease-3
MATTESSPLAAPRPAAWTVASWNVNGLRAVIRKGVLQEFLTTHAPDILCLSETKLSGKNTDAVAAYLPHEFSDYAYREYHISARRQGYSGTAIWSRHPPQRVSRGLNGLVDDEEGRVLTMEFAPFFLVNVYTPNAGQELARLEYRTHVWDPAFCTFVAQLQQTKPVIVVGDLNCAHTEIDIHAPHKNYHLAGFTPAERNNFSQLLDKTQLCDSFRLLQPDERDAYTYWSYRHYARTHNRGWRIDYALVDNDLVNKVEHARIHALQMGSDHCPIAVRIRI